MSKKKRVDDLSWLFPINPKSPTEICVGISCIPLSLGFMKLALGTGGIEETTIGVGGIAGTGIAVAESKLREFIKKHGKKKIYKVV